MLRRTLYVVVVSLFRSPVQFLCVRCPTPSTCSFSISGCLILWVCSAPGCGPAAARIRNLGCTRLLPLVHAVLALFACLTLRYSICVLGPGAVDVPRMALHHLRDSDVRLPANAPALPAVRHGEPAIRFPLRWTPLHCLFPDSRAAPLHLRAKFASPSHSHHSQPDSPSLLLANAPPASPLFSPCSHTDAARRERDGDDLAHAAAGARHGAHRRTAAILAGHAGISLLCEAC